MNSPIRSPVHVDLANMVGTFKPSPFCVDATLKQESMTADQLSKLSFQSKNPKSLVCQTSELNSEPSVVSSSSSTASRESILSDVEGNTRSSVSTPVRLERRQSELINLRVTNQKTSRQKTSRQGRQGQRWFSDPSSQKVHRLCTGCVPILEGGRVLFVSSSRKADWILPKGGWEKDESMEESAIRECFEEAGVLGILGSVLSDVDYETRKAKKRRLELQDLQKKARVRSELSSSPVASGDKRPETETDDQVIPPPSQEGFSCQEIALVSGSAKHSEETSSIASDSSQQTHSHVRMSLFPLYVTEVKSTWPESGRFRKAVGIDEAIEMCSSRPEFQAVLREVKERNLHFPPSDLVGTARIEDR